MRAPTALVVLALAALPARARAGLALPAVEIGVGQTFAVTGTPDDGGMSATLDLVWPLNERVRFGVRGFADDMGTTFGRLPVLAGSGDAGPVAKRHRACWGVSWIGEGGLWRRGPWSTAGALEWGAHRLQDDLRGTPTRAVTAIGAGATLAARRDLSTSQSVGMTLRWRQVFVNRDGPNDALLANDGSGRQTLPTGWASAALVWGWRAH